MCASAAVMLDTPCSEVVWRVLATHSIRQFPFHFPTRASPCAITYQLESTKVECSGNQKFASDKLHKTAIIVVINGANKISVFISMHYAYKPAGSCPFLCIKTTPVSSLCRISLPRSAAKSIGKLSASRLDGRGEGDVGVKAHGARKRKMS